MGWRAALLTLAAAAVAAHPAHTHSSPGPAEKKGPRRHHCGAPKPDMEKARALRRAARFNPDCQYESNTVNPANNPTNELVVKVVVHVMICDSAGKLGDTDAVSDRRKFSAISVHFRCDLQSRSRRRTPPSRVCAAARLANASSRDVNSTGQAHATQIGRRIDV